MLTADKLKTLCQKYNRRTACVPVYSAVKQINCRTIAGHRSVDRLAEELDVCSL